MCMRYLWNSPPPLFFFFVKTYQLNLTQLLNLRRINIAPSNALIPSLHTIVIGDEGGST